MSENYYTNNLYPFQDLVLKLIMKVDDAFYLTGGTALGRHYLKHRYSDDLDLLKKKLSLFFLSVKKIGIGIITLGLDVKLSTLWYNTKLS